MYETRVGGQRELLKSWICKPHGIQFPQLNTPTKLKKCLFLCRSNLVACAALLSFSFFLLSGAAALSVRFPVLLPSEFPPLRRTRFAVIAGESRREGRFTLCVAQRNSQITKATAAQGTSGGARTRCFNDFGKRLTQMGMKALKTTQKSIFE